MFPLSRHTKRHAQVVRVLDEAGALGLVPFLAFQEAVQGATGALLRNRNLVQRSVFPAELLPAIPAAVSVVTEALGMLVLIAAVWLIQGQVSWLLWLLPLLMATRLLLTLGVAWLVAVLAVFFRDLGQLVGMLLTMTFFATPILYPAELVPEHWRWLHTVNPFYHLVEAYRGVILDGAEASVGMARAVLGDDALVGVRTSAQDDALLALEIGADFVVYDGGRECPAVFSASRRPS